MDLFEAVAKRHSYRGPFRDQSVPRDDLRRIVQAGLQAPSARNVQTTRFVIVDEPELVRRIGSLHTTNPAVQTAPAMIACIVDQQLKGRDAPIKIFISRTKKGLSGVEASTKHLVLNGKEPAESANTVFVASSGIVEQMVEENSGGFATTGITSARKRNVKILKVNGIAPTNKAIINNRYPLKRPLFILMPKNPKPEVKKFVDFTLSKAGQQFIKSLNVISIQDVK